MRVNVNEIGRDGTPYPLHIYLSISSTFERMMADSMCMCACVCGSDAFMPTDFNINLLRRHVILTTYFVHTIAIVTQHAATAVMRKIS